MNIRAASRCFLALGVVAFVVLSGRVASATLPIDMEVAMESGVPVTAPQEWAKLLGKLDLNRVRLRSIRADDQPTLEARESVTGQRIKIVAILTRRNELLLPKRRFKAHNLSALKTYLEQLAAEGTEVDAERGRFDLTEKQFSAVYADLSKTIDFSTKDLTAAEVLRRLEEKIALPVSRSTAADSRLRGSPLGIELRDMAIGTALAMALRHEGLALRPEKPRGKPLQLRVLLYDPSFETWPVGWKSETSIRLLAPKMFESLTIEIANYTLTEALDALTPRLGVPLLFDRWMLNKLEIDPDKIEVKIPRGKTYLKRAVDRILGQARLAGEIRVDEQGHAFYWVTQFGKNSPRAEN
ncbi:MAG: hypothetical protein GXP26_08505 [Planctomycetes bacterium]|nr:hypothetical protein [Planctomycetota bacterium]